MPDKEFDLKEAETELVKTNMKCEHLSYKACQFCLSNRELEWIDKYAD